MASERSEGGRCSRHGGSRPRSAGEAQRSRRLRGRGGQRSRGVLGVEELGASPGLLDEGGLVGLLGGLGEVEVDAVGEGGAPGVEARGEEEVLDGEVMLALVEVEEGEGVEEVGLLVVVEAGGGDGAPGEGEGAGELGVGVEEGEGEGVEEGGVVG